MRETLVEYRTTKEILEDIVRNSFRFSTFEFKTIFYNDKMFHCVKEETSNNIYEVKITKKKRETDRIEYDGNEKNKDLLKALYLYHFSVVASYVFARVYYHEGNILIADNNNDYIVSLVKKISLKWE